jgi:hypothetical protein
LPKEHYLEEAVRIADHPGIVFRDGAGGRLSAVRLLLDEHSPAGSRSSCDRAAST